MAEIPCDLKLEDVESLSMFHSLKHTLGLVAQEDVVETEEVVAEKKEEVAETSRGDGGGEDGGGGDEEAGGGTSWMGVCFHYGAGFIVSNSHVLNSKAQYSLKFESWSCKTESTRFFATPVPTSLPASDDGLAPDLALAQMQRNDSCEPKPLTNYFRSFDSLPQVGTDLWILYPRLDKEFTVRAEKGNAIARTNPPSLAGFGHIEFEQERDRHGLSGSLVVSTEHIVGVLFADYDKLKRTAQYVPMGKWDTLNQAAATRHLYQLAPCAQIEEMSFADYELTEGSLDERYLRGRARSEPTGGWTKKLTGALKSGLEQNGISKMGKALTPCWEAVIDELKKKGCAQIDKEGFRIDLDTIANRSVKGSFISSLSTKYWVHSKLSVQANTMGVLPNMRSPTYASTVYIYPQGRESEIVPDLAEVLEESQKEQKFLSVVLWPKKDAPPDGVPSKDSCVHGHVRLYIEAEAKSKNKTKKGNIEAKAKRRQ